MSSQYLRKLAILALAAFLVLGVWLAFFGACAWLFFATASGISARQGSSQLILDLAVLTFLTGVIASLAWSFTPFGRSRGSFLFWLERKRIPQLQALLDQAPPELPRPKKLAVTPELNAYASYDGGAPGVFRSSTKLSVGLPLLYFLNLQELRAILLHELAHFEDATGMRCCAIAYELEGAANRATHGISLAIRQRIVRTQRLTVLRVAGLVYFAACSLPLRLAFDLLVPALAKARGSLYAEMEERADRRTQDFQCGQAELSSLRGLLQSAKGPLERVQPDLLSADGAKVAAACRRIAEQIGRPRPASSGNRIAWPELDALLDTTSLC